MKIGDLQNIGMSFVITSDGRESRLPLLPHIIDSIKSQGIPNTEIIVVGNNSVAASRQDELVYLHYPQLASEAWVTRLMNAGVSLAQLPLVMMLHDDVVLADGFWEGICNEEVGAWDFLTVGYLRTPGPFKGVPLAYESLQHPRWTLGGPTGHRILSDEDQWDPWSYPSGELLIGWKTAFEQQLWDPANNHRVTRGSAQAFDVQFGHAANAQGLRFSHRPDIKVWVLEL